MKKSVIFISITIFAATALFFALRPRNSSVPLLLHGHHARRPFSPESPEEINRFMKLAQTASIEEAYSRLKIEYAGPIAGHSIAHAIGGLIYNNKKIATDICDSQFQYGCSMGFAIHFAQAEGENNVHGLEHGCLGRDPAYLQILACAHGSGHGFLLRYAFNVERSLQACDAFEKDTRIHFCYSGVFMEYFNGTESGDGRLTDSRIRDNPWKLCTFLDEARQTLCAIELGKLLLTVLGPTSFIETTCRKAGHEKTAAGCAFGVGFSEVAALSDNFPQEFHSSCRRFFESSDLASHCFIGVAAGIVWFQKSWLAAESICNSLDWPYRRDCAQRIAKRKVIGN